jgi:hypothetical protein
MLLKSLDEVISEVHKDRADIRDVLLRNPADFNLQYDEKAGYRLLLEGKTYRVGPTAMHSICRLLRMPKDYFDRFPKKEEFGEHVHTLLPAASKNGLLLRLNDELQGILPGNFRVFDDDQALEFIGSMATRLLPKIKGVAVTACSRSMSVYRILFGESSLKRDEIYPVLNLSNSEIGFGPLSIDGGTYRLVCMNGSMRSVATGKKFSWNHFGDFHKKVDDLSAFMRKQAQVATETAEAIKRAVQKILPSGREEITRLNHARWISSAFAKDAQGLLNVGVPSTRYDVFNALTKASQSLRLPERLRTEAIAHAYLLSRN